MINFTDYHRRPTEAQMTEAITEVVALKGGRLWHVRDARRSPELEDMPDLLILLPPVAGLFELKSQRRKLTSGQTEVASMLRQSKEFIGGVVRPDPYVGEIAYDDVLEMLRRA